MKRTRSNRRRNSESRLKVTVSDAEIMADLLYPAVTQGPDRSVRHRSETRVR